MINIITSLLDLEKDYLKGNANRIQMTDLITNLKLDFEVNYLSKQNKDIRYYKLGLIILLERIKQRLMFEDKIVDVVENIKNNFFIKLKDLLHNPESNSSEYLTIVTELEHKQQGKKVLRRANYPHKVTKILKKWLEENVNHPYPSEIQKTLFCEKTGLDISQINNWFINARRRILPQLKRDDKTK